MNKQAKMAGRMTRRRFTQAAAAGLAAPALLAHPVRAQGAPLKIGLVLAKSGVQAFFGQSCERGALMAPALLAELGYKAKVELTTGDYESNVDTARIRAEKLIADGANVLIGCFDSGATSAVAQVAEQKGVPFVINVAAAPQITEQGYKFVFRNFSTALMLNQNALVLMKDLFKETGYTPKTCVLLHLNDTFGQASKSVMDKIFPSMGMPFKIVEAIAYDPTAKDLSVEVAKAKATEADLVMVISRLNDSITLVREMVKQRYEPKGIISPGSPGMYDDQFYKTLGKYSEYIITNTPWYNPNTDIAKKFRAAFEKKFPSDRFIGNVFNAGFTFEAVQIAVDAYTRAKSTDGKALAEALRSTNIAVHPMAGPPITFDAKGQNVRIASVALQNRNLEPTVVLPAEAAQMKPVFPMPGWNNRG